MRLVLTIHEGPQRRIEVAEGLTIVGRGADSGIVLTEESVSTSHVELRVGADFATVTDLDSLNGTEVGDVPLHRHVPRALTEGVGLRIGRVRVSVEIVPSPVDDAPGRTAEIVRELMERGLEHTRSVPLLVVAEGAELGEKLLLERDLHPYRVGRSDSADLVLSEAKVSLEHVEVRRRGNEVYVRDMGATHGSELGAGRLETGKWTYWPDNLHLSLGAVVLAVRGVQATPSVPLVGSPAPPPSGTPAAEPAPEQPAAPPAPPTPVGGPIAAAPKAAAPLRTPKAAPLRLEIAVYVAGAALLVACVGLFVWVVFGSTK